jgi:site-specific recombinase XerD
MAATDGASELGAIMRANRLVEQYLSLQGANTRRKYARIYKKWVAWVQKRHWLMPDRYFLDPGAGDVLDYVRHLADQGVKDSTVRDELTVLRSLYKWLFTKGHTRSANPFAIKLPKPQDQSKPTERLPNHEIRRLLACWGDSYDESLRRSILSLLFGCGLRRQEVCDLLAADVILDAATPHIIIRIQKNKTRSELPIPEWALLSLTHYLEHRKAAPGSQTEPYFFVHAEAHGHSKIGRRICDTFVRRTFKEALKRCGLSADVYSCHSARVSAITKLLEDGVGHREVQEFSRHASVAMVEKYDRRRFSLEQNPGRQLKF